MDNMTRFGFTPFLPTFWTDDAIEHGLQLFREMRAEMTAEAPDNTAAKTARDAKLREWEQVELPDHALNAFRSFDYDVLGATIDEDERVLASWDILLTNMLSEVKSLLKFRLSVATATQAQAAKPKSKHSNEDLEALRNIIFLARNTARSMGSDAPELTVKDLPLVKGRKANDMPTVQRPTASKALRYFLDGNPEPLTPVQLARAMGRPWTMATLERAVNEAGERITVGWDREDEETGEPFVLEIGDHKITCSIV